MPVKCSACSHPSRNEVDSALVEGGTIRDVAGRFSLSRGAVERHRAHISAALLAAKETKEAESVKDAVTLLRRVRALHERAETLLDQAETRALSKNSTARDVVAAATCMKELRSVVELLDRLTGELQPGSGPTVNVAVQVGQGGQSPQREHSPEELRHMARLALEEADRMDRARGLLVEGSTS